MIQILKQVADIKDLDLETQNSHFRRFKLHINHRSAHAIYQLMDHTQMAVGHQGELYAFQKTNRSVAEIIRYYWPVAQCLNISLIVH